MAASSWPRVSLGDHVDLLTGFPFKSKFFTSDPEDIPLVKGENVQQGYIDWEEAKRWPCDVAEEYERYRLKVGDVVLAMDRPWIEAGLKFAWIKRHDPECLLVQRVARMRGDESLLTDYLRYIIASPSFTAYIRPIVTGVNVPHISPQQIKGFHFILPPLEFQQKAVAILSVFDDLIENSRLRIKILEEIAGTIFAEWFVRFKFPGHEAVPIIDSPRGKIPEGWFWSSVSDAVELDPKTPIEGDKERPYIPMAALTPNSMTITGIEMRRGKSGSKFRNGDTLFARITPSTEHGKTAFVQFLPLDTDTANGSTEFIVMRSRTLNPYCVYLLAKTSNLRQHAIKSMTGTSGRQRVQVQCFDSFFIPHADKNTLGEFERMVAPIFRLVQTLLEETNVLRRQRDILLPKLVSGELDISDLDIKVEDVNA